MASSQILPPGSVDPISTWLIIANVLYLKGTRANKFAESYTEEDDFHILDGKRFECPSWRAKGDNMLVLGAHVQPHCLHHLRWRSIHGGPRLSFLNGVLLEQPLKLQEPFKELAGGAITQKVYFWTTQTKKWSLTRSQFYYYFNPANKKM